MKMNKHSKNCQSLCIFALLAVGLSITSSACMASDNDAANDVADSAQQQASEWQLGPLDEYMFAITGTQPNPTAEQSRAVMIRDDRIREELVAACMAEQGFTYIPNLPEIIIMPAIQNADALEWGTREFVAQAGFGISVRPPASGLGGVGPAMTPDPNEALRAAMSASERAAWEEALWGGEPTAFGAGCSGLAWQQMQQPDGFAAIAAEVESFRLRLQHGTAPEIAGLNAEWAACMTEAGFTSLPVPRGLVMALNLEFQALQGWVIEENEFGNTQLSRPPGATDPTPQQLAAFTEREIAIAVTDYDCRAQISYEQRFNQIDIELQQEFVAQFRNELAAWREFAEARFAGG